MEIENQRAENSPSDPLYKQHLHRTITQPRFKKQALPTNPMPPPPPQSTGSDQWVIALETASVTDPSHKVLQQRRIKQQKRLKTALKHHKQHHYAAPPNFSPVFDDGVIVVVDDDEDLGCDGKLWSSSDDCGGGGGGGGDQASNSDLSAAGTDDLGNFLHTRGITGDIQKYARDEVFHLSSVEEVCVAFSSPEIPHFSCS